MGVMPRAYKEICRGLQPILKSAADGCQLLHDLYTWNHPSSPNLAVALLMLAIFCGIVSSSTLLMLTGSFVMLVCSPVPTAVLGLVAYVQCTRVRANDTPSSRMVCAN